ncbi:MAG: TonB-dependent receptor [Bacteroidales bacterium]|nr:TonB-dependent receptor [Bacteroidales bacterium]
MKQIKQIKHFAVVMLLSMSATAMAQDSVQGLDTLPDVELDVVKVLSARVPLTTAQTPQQVTIIGREEIQKLPVNTIDDLLKYAVGVDVRQRGNGVQTDICVHGGTFDQVTILLNGINITSPHTGHLSADFPISADDIERIEILEGPSARAFGTSAFTGTVNIVTRNADPSHSRLGTAVSGLVNVFGGDHGHAGANANVTLGHNAGNASTNHPARLVHTLSGGYVRDDGDTPNSAYETSRIYYNVSYKSADVKGNFQAGYSYKPYEANTFYGAASQDQWESNEHFVIAANGEISAGKIHITPSFAADRRYDHYQWHKGSPKGENFHRCDVRTAGVGVWADNRFGRTSFAAEMRSELIYSTKLGSEMEQSAWFATKGRDGVADVNYNHSADRTNIYLMAEHDIILPKWTIAFALPAINNTALDHKWRFCPGMDVAYRPDYHWKLFANINSALRMPTFTDLYYSGANIEGTTNLKPERTVDFGAGAKARYEGFWGEIRLYGSHRTDMIDWVVYEDEKEDGIFRSGNFQLDNRGCEISAALMPREIWLRNPVTKIQIQYAYNDADISYTRAVAASKYAMEYLRHRVLAGVDVRIAEGLGVNVSYRYNHRVGEGNDPYSLVDAGARYEHRRWVCYINVTNLLDNDYRDFSYIEQSGRRFVIGAKVRF